MWREEQRSDEEEGDMRVITHLYPLSWQEVGPCFLRLWKLSLVITDAAIECAVSLERSLV